MQIFKTLYVQGRNKNSEYICHSRNILPQFLTFFIKLWRALVFFLGTVVMLVSVLVPQKLPSGGASLPSQVGVFIIFKRGIIPRNGILVLTLNLLGLLASFGNGSLECN